MRQPGRRKRVVDLGSDRRPNAEQDPGTQGGLRFGHDRVEPVEQCASAPGKDRSRPRCRLDELRAPWAPDRSDALPRQVLAVREAVEVLGQLDARPYPQAIPAAGVDATRHPDQQSIGQRHWPAVDGSHQVAEDELDPILSRPRIVHDPADELVFLAVDEAGDRAQLRCSRRISARLAPGANGGECNDDTDQKQAAARQRPRTDQRARGQQPNRCREKQRERGGDGEIGGQDPRGGARQRERKGESTDAHRQPAVATPWMSSSWPRLITPRWTASSSDANGCSWRAATIF